MAVPIPVIAGVAAVVLIIILLIIFKILRKRKQSASEETGKGEYQKLESGERGSEAGLEEGNEIVENESGGKAKKKKRKKGGKSKGKSKRKESQDLESEEGAALNDSSAFTEDLAIPLISRLQFSISYSPTSRQILLTIHRGENLGSGSAASFEVRVTLLPSKRQKLKTKSQPSGSPEFNELLVFNEVFPEDIELATLRARVYRLTGRQRNLIGEVRADLKADLGLDTSDVDRLWRELTPAADIADDISDTQFVIDPESVLAAPKETVPMLLISLQYKTVTGRLTVEIIKARHMKTLNVQKVPEAFVEVSLLNANGSEISNQKTGVCKGSFHPAFEETFYFPAIEFDLTGLTLVFSVYCKKFRKKELIGWFGIGRESTGERQQLHWDEMIDARGEPIRGWYALSQE